MDITFFWKYIEGLSGVYSNVWMSSSFNTYINAGRFLDKNGGMVAIGISGSWANVREAYQRPAL